MKEPFGGHSATSPARLQVCWFAGLQGTGIYTKKEPMKVELGLVGKNTVSPKSGSIEARE